MPERDAWKAPKDLPDRVGLPTVAEISFYREVDLADTEFVGEQAVLALMRLARRAKADGITLLFRLRRGTQPFATLRQKGLLAEREDDETANGLWTFLV